MKPSDYTPPTPEDLDPTSVESVAQLVEKELQAVFERFQGAKVTPTLKADFKDVLCEVLAEVDLGADDDSPMDYIEVVVASDDAHPEAVFVTFEPLDPKLRSPRMKIARHRKAEDQAPIYCALVDGNMAISGWGPTPIHAVAELQKNHGES